MNTTDKRVCFLNDKKVLNDQYRSSLMGLFRNREYVVCSVGLFHPRWSSPVRLVRMVLSLYPRAVSSNFRTNLVFLSAFWLSGLVILNGLGRYRNRWALRAFLITVLRFTKTKQIAAQSYADYRYLRRFARLGDRLNWVPGSGGTVKTVGTGQGFVAVQRDSKLPLIADDIIDLLSHLDAKTQLQLVGCRDQDFAHAVLPESRICLKGVVPASDILAYGSTFVQPSGYGEGFPHSLADALVSGMDVIIARREFLRSGLYRLTAGRRIFDDRWVAIAAQGTLQELLSTKAVNEAYFELFEGPRR